MLFEESLVASLAGRFSFSKSIDMGAFFLSPYSGSGVATLCFHELMSLKEDVFDGLHSFAFSNIGFGLSSVQTSLDNFGFHFFAPSSGP